MQQCERAYLASAELDHPIYEREEKIVGSGERERGKREPLRRKGPSIHDVLKVFRFLAPLLLVRIWYRDRLKGLYVVARNFFLLLLNFSAWPCLAVA